MNSSCVFFFFMLKRLKTNSLGLINKFHYCIVLHCIVLYYTVLYCFVLSCLVLYCIVLYLPFLTHAVLVKSYAYAFLLCLIYYNLEMLTLSFQIELRMLFDVCYHFLFDFRYCRFVIFYLLCLTPVCICEVQNSIF